MRLLANQQLAADHWSLDYDNGSSSLDDLDLKRRSMTTLGHWRIFALLGTGIIILFTICGNAMTLYAVCKMKTFQNSISNLYIASLAAADLIVGSFVMTLMMLYTIVYDGVWVFGYIMCDVWQAVDLISCTISLYSICAIGFDRWLNLEKPLRIFKRNRLTAKRALACIWISPVIIWASLMAAMRSRNGPPLEGTCSFVWRPNYVVPMVAVPLFYVPVFALMVLFVRISLVIRSHLIFLHKHSNQQNASTSLFDFDRSVASSPFGSTPASSRRRSANTPAAGSLINLKMNGTVAGGFCGNLNFANGGNGKFQKFKPPPLSPIVSVNVTAVMNSSNRTTNGDAAAAVSELDFNYSTRCPNQSPLAMKVLRDRLSPKSGPNASKGQQETKQEKEKEDSSPVFEFPLSEYSEKTKEKPANGAAKETTPLLCPNFKTQSGQGQRIGQKKSIDTEMNRNPENDALERANGAAKETTPLLCPNFKTQSGQGQRIGQKKSIDTEINGNPENGALEPANGAAKKTTPLLCPNFKTQSGQGQRIGQKKWIDTEMNRNPENGALEPPIDADDSGLHKRSVSRDSVDIAATAADQKRSSVTSDTAVFFTKRFLTQKPPLLRAKTETVLETNTRRMRPSARFSIISVTAPLFSRKYSMNIFSDMFPHGGITQQIRAAKAVGIIMIFFLISWTPFLVLWPLKTFCPECVSNRMYQLSIWANYLNSTLNPIVYTLCSPRFRRLFRKRYGRCPLMNRARKRNRKKQLL